MFQISFEEEPAGQLTDRDRARVAAVLRRIRVGPERGCWRESPEHVRVRGRLTRGCGGALVVQVDLYQTGQDPAQGARGLGRVLKVGAPGAMRAEWEAYSNVIAARLTTLCAPIEAVTPGVTDPGRELDGEDEAVVYTDVKDFAVAATPPVSLENLVTRAAAGPPAAVDAAVAAIDRLLTKAGRMLYRHHRVVSVGDRLDVQRSLGPDLRLRVDRVDAPRLPPGQEPRRRSGTGPALPLEVLAAGRYLPETASAPPDRDIQEGDTITLSSLAVRREGDQWLGERDGATVELTAEPAGEPLARLGGLDDGTPGVSVHGTVTATRSRDTWQRLRRPEALPGLTLVADGVTAAADIAVEGTVTAHPFAALDRILAAPVHGLVTGAVHGDLNANNVLVADDQPFLIDYPAASPNRSILLDHAWLELNLLRGSLAEGLSYADLVLLQRLLFLTELVAVLLPKGEEAVLDSLDARSPRLATAARLLGTIRRHARRTYPHELTRRPWWHEYLTQLVLAAHRMLKWPEELQTEVTWRAQLAVAAAATEPLLAPDDPFAWWPAADLAAAADVVLPRLPPSAAALPILAALVRGLDSPHERGERRTEDVDRLRAQIARTIRAVPPDADRLRAQHDLYIDLSAHVRTPPARDVGDDLAADLAAAPDPARPEPSAVDAVARATEAVLLGGHGAGKTALLEELAYRLLSDPPDGTLARLPVRLRPTAISSALTTAGGTEDHPSLAPLAESVPAAGDPSVSDLLTIGAIHLMVDDLSDLEPEGRTAVLGWLRQVRKQFPRTPAVVCWQGTAVPEALAGRSAVLLNEPDAEQISSYLVRAREALGLQAAPLVASVLHDPAHHGARELARNPMLLSLLARTATPAGVPGTVGDLLDGYVRSSGIDAASSQCAKAVAERLVDAGQTGTGEADFLAAAGASVAECWDHALARLTAAGVLTTDGETVRFRHPVFRHYFAASRLRTAPPARLHALARRFRWRDAVAILASMKPTGREVVGSLVEAIGDADPPYVARLLRHVDHPELEARFATEQEHRLRDPRAGQVAQARAADALTELATWDAYRQLLRVLGDRAVDRTARVASLDVLVRACQTPGRYRDRLVSELTSRLESLLDDENPELLTPALRAIGELRLQRLQVLVFTRVSRSDPWPVRQAAMTALDALGTVLPGAFRSDHQRERLVAIEDELPRTTASVDVNALQAERYRLLGGRPPPGDWLPWLLQRRFAFEIGAPVAHLIEFWSRRNPETSTRHAAILTREVANPEQFLGDLEGSDPLAAAAAAHLLLRDRHRRRAAWLFRRLATSDRPDHVAMAAAATEHLPTSALPEAAALFRRLVPGCGAPGGTPPEPMASLVQAIHARDPRTGIRLVWEAHRSLTERGRAERLHWPWVTVVARCGGTPEPELEALLLGDAADAALAVDALATCAGFLLTADPGPELSFGDAARRRVLDMLLAASPETSGRLAGAAAALGLTDALPAVCSLARGRSADASPVETVAATGLGLVEVAPVAGLLAAAGYLAKLSATVTPAAASEANALLRTFDTAGMHASVETSRLTGLAYLGDWLQVLSRLRPDDARRTRVARNAVQRWMPGPFTPADWSGWPEVARWIADSLTDPDLPPKTRSTLLELQRTAEERIGELVAPPRAP